MVPIVAQVAEGANCGAFLSELTVAVEALVLGLGFFEELGVERLMTVLAVIGWCE
jgi:hypothetical protein